MSAESHSLPHLTSEELAAYLDGLLDAKSAARLESHLSQCRECRAELVATRELVESAAAAARRRETAPAWRARRWLAAAGIIAVALLPLIERGRRARDDTAQVRAASSGPLAITVVAPKATFRVVTVTFIWRPVERATSYRLTVTDSAGASLFTVATSDTVASLPANTHLERGASYLWYLDCLMTDGRTVSSGIQSFAIAK